MIVLLELSAMEIPLAAKEALVAIVGTRLAEPPHPDNAANTHNVKKYFIPIFMGLAALRMSSKF